MRDIGSGDVRLALLLGAFADFVSVRCQYLFEHPDGAPGGTISGAPGTLELGTLIRGALLELFGTIERKVYQDISHIADFDMPTPRSITIGFRTPSTQEPQGAGAAIIKALARRSQMVAKPSGGEWQVEIDADSVRAGVEVVSPYMFYLGK